MRVKGGGDNRFIIKTSHWRKEVKNKKKKRGSSKDFRNRILTGDSTLIWGPLEGRGAGDKIILTYWSKEEGKITHYWA